MGPLYFISRSNVNMSDAYHLYILSPDDFRFYLVVIRTASEERAIYMNCM